MQPSGMDQASGFSGGSISFAPERSSAPSKGASASASDLRVGGFSGVVLLGVVAESLGGEVVEEEVVEAASSFFSSQAQSNAAADNARATLLSMSVTKPSSRRGREKASKIWLTD